MSPHDASGEETPPHCEAVLLVSTDGSDPCENRVIEPDGYVECSNDAVGRYRIAPDRGEVAINWLCSTHREKYDDIVDETLTTLT